MAYTLFDNIIEKEDGRAFLIAGKKLLEELDIQAPVLQDSKADIATEGKAINEETFFLNHAHNLSAAKKQGADILCIDDSSYLSLNLTKESLLEDSELLGRIAAKLDAPVSLDVKIVHINEVLRDDIGFLELQKKISRPFSDFKLALFEGNKIEHSGTNASIMTLLGAELIAFNKANKSDGYEIASKSTAFELAGTVLLDAFDNAADFVVTNDTRSFVMFDKHQKSLERTVGREIELPIFSTAQLVLLAMGVEDKDALGMTSHKVKAKLI